jgi:hypothetical protein
MPKQWKLINSENVAFTHHRENAATNDIRVKNENFTLGYSQTWADW